MDTARWERVQALFDDALALPEPERLAFLDAASGGDADLVAEVEALLAEDAAGADGAPLLEGRDLADLAHDVLDGSVPALRRVGPYRVLGVLGQGGMGVVYLAERERLGHRVAVKVLRDAALSPARRERFAREEQTLAALTHPAIARLYSADVLADGTPYFVMEAVDGQPITDYCAAHESTLGERLRLFRDVCDAVCYAHQQAIIHRDLKPSNIFVTADGAVKLLDFGIAKPIEGLGAPAAQTQTGLRLMTPAYAAPEQIRGEPVGTYTDVYALGVVLYELLAGCLPFDLDGLTPGQAEALILEQPPERPSARLCDGGVPGPIPRRAWADLDVLCLTAMHEDPARRYGTIDALLRDLDRFRDGRPLEAQPDSLGYRAGKFLRRHREVITASALVVALIVALVGFYTLRLADARDAALAEAAKAEQVSDYLLSLFEAGDPYAADSLSVRALLEQGVEQAEALEDQPAVQAQMLDVLGRVYLLLSQYDRAAALLHRAVDLRREGDPLDLAESLVNLGELHIYAGAYDSAEVVTREALALHERHLPPGHPDLAATLDNLGVILSRQGDYAAAGALYRLALTIRRNLYDRPHEDLSNSLNNLAVNLYRQGDYDAAEAYYRESIAVDRVVFGPDHPSVATGLANLGKLFEERGDYAAAEGLLTEALRIRRAALGAGHYETALSLSQLGGLLQRAGQPDRATPYLREALATREQLLGPDHISTATTRSHFAAALQEQGDYATADTLFRRVLEAYRMGLGDDHWYTGAARCNLGRLFHLRGEPEAAEAAYREGLAVLRGALPAGHQTIAHNEGRFGLLLLEQGRFAEAEPLLLASFEGIGTARGADHPDTREAARRLIELYEAAGRPDDADRYRAELVVAAEGRGAGEG
ncbi:MAG: serine/threonine-protein kinase [Rhodothermales bacterium]